MRTETLPTAAHEAAEERCGPDTKFTLITDRRGSAVWKGRGARGIVAVKSGTDEGAAITARESAVLAAMAPGRLLASGSAGHTAWMITPWHSGPSTWDALRGVRHRQVDPEAARSSVVDLCRAVAQLHAAGWVHSDLQPGHAIHTGQGVVLIDCSWAWHYARLAPSRMFRGGMPHLLAPELAAAVEAGMSPVAPDPAAETYTLAASLWWAITGDWPLDYAAAGVDPSELSAAQLRKAIGLGQFRVRLSSTWPAVQDVLRAVLTEPPGRRLTASALAAAVAR
ncbi:hypothetical protein [Streptomyces sp. NPDC049915]|uniref:hypothetical protein n=1 Tax=Streptomyces sp. NPDC049915 TaxID=3155510 RepID=UPI0034188721